MSQPSTLYLLLQAIRCDEPEVTESVLRRAAVNVRANPRRAVRVAVRVVLEEIGRR